MMPPNEARGVHASATITQNLETTTATVFSFLRSIEFRFCAQMGCRKIRSFDYLMVEVLSFLLVAVVTSAAQTQSDSFYSLLRSHGLPIGIVPQNITNFKMDETTGRFEVNLDRSCSAKFENAVHYEINVSGTLTYGQIGDLSGMSAQELFLWFPVKMIRVDVPTSGLIYFDVGGVVSKQFSLSLFETPPDCVDVGPVEVDDQMLNFSRMERQSDEPQIRTLQPLQKVQ